MASAGGISEEKFYDPIHDVWRDLTGKTYIKNEFNSAFPVWIDISENRWIAQYAGTVISLNWDSLSIPPGMLNPIKETSKKKLKKLSLGYLGNLKSALKALQCNIENTWSDFGDIETSAMLDIWLALPPRHRLVFRSLYVDMARVGIGGACLDIASEMRMWLARKKVILLRDVLGWHPTRGALIASEEEVLRQTLSALTEEDQSLRQRAVTIYAWLLLDTLKRPSQILDISKDGLKCIDNNGQKEWFVQVRPIKHQTGLPHRWWPISPKLAEVILAFSEKPEVAQLQNMCDRLLVVDIPALHERKVLSVAAMTSDLTALIYKSGAISPRTGKLLVVTPMRIRHTGATRLAFAGVSRDIIQEILEHDNATSCQSYIDAVGTDIVSQIEKAGRAMGNIFYELNKVFFQGKIVPEITGPPILAPQNCTSPLIVGSCGWDSLKYGSCKRHPFVSCYAECSSFLAWSSPEPHEKALSCFKAEIANLNPDSSPTDSLSIPVRHSIAILERAAGAANDILMEIRGGA